VAIYLKKQLSQHIKDIIEKTFSEYKLNDFSVRIENPPKIDMGHYSSPCAMDLAKILKSNPRKIATELYQAIIENKKSDSLPANLIEKISVEGPGFINFYVDDQFLSKILLSSYSTSSNIEQLKKDSPFKEEKIIFEFVSANPTGPLNIVSARAASVGDSICNVLEICGFQIAREYYVNDFGNQISLLGQSLCYRYLQSKGEEIELPENCYQGEYIKDILSSILLKDSSLRESLEESYVSNFDLKKFIESFSPTLGLLATEKLLETQQKDLQAFNVNFDNFFKEASLHKANKVMQTFDDLKQRDVLYQKENAWFFKSTDYDDDKDRVVLRSDGRPTYLLADITYHRDKIQRGFHKIYNIWGPDHHGYIARLKGSLKALGFGEKKGEGFDVLIAQQVNLMEKGKPVVMSKRLGKFQTMKDLIDKIPVDVSRYFFANRSLGSHLDFDLELALEKSNENPVYYIQYAHARIHSIFQQNNYNFDSFDISIKNLTLEKGFFSATRKELLINILKLQEEVYDISRNFEIQRLPAYLHNLASIFTSFYHEKENRVKTVLENDKSTGEALLQLCKLTANTIKTGLTLIGVTSPKKM